VRIVKCEQRTREWFTFRLGIPTASEFDNIVTPLFKARTGAGVETYLAKKAAERWLKKPLTMFSGGAMEQGSIKEDEAIPWYELTTGRKIKEIGFVTTDDGRIGCSPDGMFDDGTGIEVKCPEIHTHVRYLLAGEVPSDYVTQVQGAMLVTGATCWKFLSYCRGLPPLMLDVPRDDKGIEAMQSAIDAFNLRLDAAFNRLLEIQNDRA
jgi:hypothetical protein